MAVEILLYDLFQAGAGARKVHPFELAGSLLTVGPTFMGRLEVKDPVASG